LTTRWQRALEPADAGGVTDDGFDGDASLELVAPLRDEVCRDEYQAAAVGRCQRLGNGEGSRDGLAGAGGIGHEHAAMSAGQRECGRELPWVKAAVEPMHGAQAECAALTLEQPARRVEGIAWRSQPRRRDAAGQGLGRSDGDERGGLVGET